VASWAPHVKTERGARSESASTLVNGRCAGISGTAPLPQFFSLKKREKERREEKRNKNPWLWCFAFAALLPLWSLSRSHDKGRCTMVIVSRPFSRWPEAKLCYVPSDPRCVDRCVLVPLQARCEFYLSCRDNIYSSACMPLFSSICCCFLANWMDAWLWAPRCIDMVQPCIGMPGSDPI